jgi:hypothetical protein
MVRQEETVIKIIAALVNFVALTVIQRKNKIKHCAIYRTQKLVFTCECER